MYQSLDAQRTCISVVFFISPCLPSCQGFWVRKWQRTAIPFYSHRPSDHVLSLRRRNNDLQKIRIILFMPFFCKDSAFVWFLHLSETVEPATIANDSLNSGNLKLCSQNVQQRANFSKGHDNHKLIIFLQFQAWDRMPDKCNDLINRLRDRLLGKLFLSLCTAPQS